MYKDTTFLKGKHIPKIIKDIRQLPRNSRIIELGCGDGDVIIELNRLGLIDAFDFFAVDLLENQLNSVKKINQGIKTVCADTCNLEMLKNETFDFVYSCQVLEHVKNDSKTVKEIYRILKRGGKYYVDTVLKKWYGWYFYRNNGRWVLHPEHIREYKNLNELRILFESNNLTVDEANVEQLYYSTQELFSRLKNKLKPIDNRQDIKTTIDIKIPILGYKIPYVSGRKV